MTEPSAILAGRIAGELERVGRPIGSVVGLQTAKFSRRLLRRPQPDPGLADDGAEGIGLHFGCNQSSGIAAPLGAPRRLRVRASVQGPCRSRSSSTSCCWIGRRVPILIGHQNLGNLYHYAAASRRFPQAIHHLAGHRAQRWHADLRDPDLLRPDAGCRPTKHGSCKGMRDHLADDPAKADSHFEGIRSDEDEDRWGYGWRCYCGIPEQSFRTDGSAARPYTGQVYLVFVNDEKVAYNWRWETADLENPRLPVDHETRFKQRLL